MNRKNYTLLVLLLSLFTLSACDRDAHKDENGLTVSMNILNDDDIRDVRLWIYQSNGALVEEYHCTSIKELAMQRFSLPAGNYVLIAANNLVSPFSVDKQIVNGKKPYESMLFALDEASASPTHAHYGMQIAKVDALNATTTEVLMSRILAELQFTIKGVPSEVIKVDAKMTNAAKSFLPYSGELLPDIDVVTLGSVTPKNGIISFPMKRVMPVRDASVRAVSSVSSRFAFTFYYTDGNTIELTAKAPAIENGGSYTPEVVYDIFRPGIEITITDINGWIKGETSQGEILNPKNE